MCESPSLSSDLWAQTERHVAQSVSQWPDFFPCFCHNRDSDSAHVTVEAEMSPPQTCWVRSIQTTKTSQATAYLKNMSFFAQYRSRSREIGLGVSSYLEMLNLLWIFNISKKETCALIWGKISEKVLWFPHLWVYCETIKMGSIVSQVISPSDKANQVLYHNTREPFSVCIVCTSISTYRCDFTFILSPLMT